MSRTQVTAQLPHSSTVTTLGSRLEATAVSVCRARSSARPSGTNIFHQPDIRSTTVKHNRNRLPWPQLKSDKQLQLRSTDQSTCGLAHRRTATSPRGRRSEAASLFSLCQCISSSPCANPQTLPLRDWHTPAPLLPSTRNREVSGGGANGPSPCRFGALLLCFHLPLPCSVCKAGGVCCWGNSGSERLGPGLPTLLTSLLCGWNKNNISSTKRLNPKVILSRKSKRLNSGITFRKSICKHNTHTHTHHNFQNSSNVFLCLKSLYTFDFIASRSWQSLHTKLYCFCQNPWHGLSIKSHENKDLASIPHQCFSWHSVILAEWMDEWMIFYTYNYILLTLYFHENGLLLVFLG